jgi:hypothetical protein
LGNWKEPLSAISIIDRSRGFAEARRVRKRWRRKGRVRLSDAAGGGVAGKEARRSERRSERRTERRRRYVASIKVNQQV